MNSSSAPSSASTSSSLLPRRLIALVVTLVVLLGAWAAPLGEPARASVDAGLKRALVAFAAARTLGAVISVAQGTQVDIKPGGVGVGTAPGQVLQPVNELVDHFATAMLAASVAFGVQRVLLDIGGAPAVAAALSVVAVAWFAAMAWRDGRAARWLQPALVLLLLARFAVPAIALANERLYVAYMKPQHDAALALVDRTPEAVPDPAVAEKRSLPERFERWWKGMPDLRAGYAAILASASTWADRIVDLMVVFLVQTVIVPVGGLWLTWRIARWATSAPGGGGRRLA